MMEGRCGHSVDYAAFPSEAYARWQDTPSDGPTVFCDCQHEYEDHRELIVDFGDETRDVSPCRRCRCADFKQRESSFYLEGI